MSDGQKCKFRTSCRDFLVTMLRKLLEKALITYPLVRLLSWMDPRQMAKKREKLHIHHETDKHLAHHGGILEGAGIIG